MYDFVVKHENNTGLPETAILRQTAFTLLKNKLNRFKTGLELDDYTQDEHPYREPSVFIAVNWWQKHIDSVDPGWKLRAIALHKSWLGGRKKDRRRFLSNFLNEMECELQLVADKLCHDNHLKDWTWASRFAYIMTTFSYIYESFYT